MTLDGEGGHWDKMGHLQSVLCHLNAPHHWLEQTQRVHIEGQPERSVRRSVE